MAWWIAPIYDWLMRDLERACGDAWRRDLLTELQSDVLEIGAGTGKNLEHYRELDRLVLAEPDPHMRRKLVTRTQAPVAKAVDVVPWTAEALDAPDRSFDAVVSTLVLCSVREPTRALAEIRRVLRPGGRLVFFEHVASDDPGLRAWQQRLEPIWRPIAGNCHLCRETRTSIEAAGFTFERIVHERARKTLPVIRSTIRGYALVAT